MNLKTLGVLAVVMVAAGGAAAYIEHRTGDSRPCIEAKTTDEMARNIALSQDIAIARQEAVYERVKTEVRTIYVETKAKVMALPPDAVADGLNAERALWRGVEGGAGGVDGE